MGRNTVLAEDFKAAAKYGAIVETVPFDLAAKAVLGMNPQLAKSYAERRVKEASSSDKRGKIRPPGRQGSGKSVFRRDPDKPERAIRAHLAKRRQTERSIARSSIETQRLTV
jgi:hypothetical protein